MTIPPHLLEIESNILGTYMESPSLFDDCEHLVSANIFLRPVTKASYTVIKQLHAKGVRPDFSLLYTNLKGMGFTHQDCVVQYSSNYKYQHDIKEYVEILFKHSVANYLLPILQDTHQKLSSNSGDAIEVMTKLKDSITNVDLVVNNVSKDKNTSDIFDETLSEIKTAMSTTKGMGFSTGLVDVDKITGGLYPGIFVIGGRPGMGKSAAIVKIIVKNAIELNVPVIMFSLEMPAKQVMRRIISNVCQVNSYAIKTGQINQEDLSKIEQSQIRLKNNLIIDDTPAITWQYIDSKLRKIRKTVPIEQEMIVLIDYMQLMSNTLDEAKGRTDEALMSIRCNKLNAMWKTHNTCIIELSQLGREVERRAPPRPKMSDLKESGSLEANADVVILMYRPDYYEEFPKDENGADLKGLVEFNMAKNRHGNSKAAYARFVGQYSDFKDYNPNIPF